MESKKFLDKEEDSIIIFSSRSRFDMEKQVIGKQRSNIDVIL